MSYHLHLRKALSVLLNHKTVGFGLVRFQSQSSMLSCLVSRPDLPSVMFDMLKEHCTLDIWPNQCTIPRNQLAKRIQGKNALVCTLADRIDCHILNSAGDSLRVIGTLSVGFDHIDINECRKRGIAVGNTPDVLTDAVAELTLALLLATSRCLFQAEKVLRK